MFSRRNQFPRSFTIPKRRSKFAELFHIITGWFLVGVVLVGVIMLLGKIVVFDTTYILVGEEITLSYATQEAVGWKGNDNEKTLGGTERLYLNDVTRGNGEYLLYVSSQAKNTRYRTVSKYTFNIGDTLYIKRSYPTFFTVLAVDMERKTVTLKRQSIAYGKSIGMFLRVPTEL